MSTANTPRTILVTGATGLIGRRLVVKLLDLNHQLIVLSRRPEKAAELGDAIRVVRSVDELPTNLPLDVVIHLAGEPVAGKLWSSARKRFLKQSRAELPSELGRWFAKASHPPSLWLGASAIGWYGTPVDADQEFTEQSFLENKQGEHKQGEHKQEQRGFAAQLCAHIESCAENACAVLRDAPAFRCVHLRIGLVLATPPEGGYLAKLVTPVKYMVGTVLGDGRQWQSWIHIDDAVDSIVHCLEDSSLSGPVNLTAPNPTRAGDLMRAIGSAVGRPVFFRMPAGILRLVAGDMADDLLLASQRVLPSRLLDSGFEFTYPKLTDALKNLLSP